MVRNEDKTKAAPPDGTDLASPSVTAAITFSVTIDLAPATTTAKRVFADSSWLQEPVRVPLTRRERDAPALPEGLSSQLRNLLFAWLLGKRSPKTAPRCGSP